MYWVVLSGVLLAESWTVWILGWYVQYIRDPGPKPDAIHMLSLNGS